jgi:RepB DNA-primase from phage plasmid
MFDHGLHLTLAAIRRQLAAMPHDLYLIRLIHSQTRRAFPGERLWTAAQLTQAATVRFLRLRNRQGCDIYVQPYAPDGNPGYILVDLDQAGPAVIETMRTNGHAPCVVLQTSPGNLQVWVHVSVSPLEPALASRIGRQLARLYGGDPASTDWRHLGRLAGFTNQKPRRRGPSGYAPWVQLRHAQAGLAAQGAALLQAASHDGGGPAPGSPSVHALPPNSNAATNPGPPPSPAEAAHIYGDWLQRLRIPQRFPQPDWSIADKWVAKELLRQGTPAGRVSAILAGGSPGFPRQHADPQDYLRRTLACAARALAASLFSGRQALPHRALAPTAAPVCHAESLPSWVAAPAASVRSNCTGDK